MYLIWKAIKDTVANFCNKRMNKATIYKEIYIRRSVMANDTKLGFIETYNDGTIYFVHDKNPGGRSLKLTISNVEEIK